MNILNLEDEKFKTVEIQNKKFKIRFISPFDRIVITQVRMKMQGGNPVEAMTQDDFMYFENIAICNTCIEELPKGFKENESCVSWNSIDLINEVAFEIKKHTSEIEAKLKKNRPIEGGE